MTEASAMTLDELYEEFDDLGDWDAQCDFLIDLGFDLPELADEHRIEANRVHGCQSNVWMIADVRPSVRNQPASVREPANTSGQTNADSARSDGEPSIAFTANSDAIIVNGLIAVLMILFNGRTPREILAVDVHQVFTRLGLERHLSPQRRNGLYGMVERIRRIAAEATS